MAGVLSREKSELSVSEGRNLIGSTMLELELDVGRRLNRFQVEEESKKIEKSFRR